MERGDEEYDDGDEEGEGKKEHMLELATFKTAIMQNFLNPERKLEVQEVRLVFDCSTVRGKRKAFHDAFVVMSQAEGNIFRRSSIWTRGVITGIPVLNIESMKRIGAEGPLSSKKLVKKGLATLTAVQRGRQALGGIELHSMLLKSVLEGVKTSEQEGGVGGTTWVDERAKEWSVDNMLIFCAMGAVSRNG